MSQRDGKHETTPKSHRDQALSVDPEVATFTTAGGKSEHMLVNLSDNHLAVKVRCSNNQLYRVRPVYQVVETGQCKSLIVTRLIDIVSAETCGQAYHTSAAANCRANLPHATCG
ncbi:MSP domain protein [Teladorsagia circumcincta]|uniref:MSP domain protein n=1 Tax=Teladorsagia circumcincta TaxID=45464 RepID=A0A2G9TWP5_TELCI|nr:MSP domain protein [Teladorsagia circumcincta]